MVPFFNFRVEKINKALRQRAYQVHSEQIPIPVKAVNEHLVIDSGGVALHPSD